jgi:hypothetical protein
MPSIILTEKQLYVITNKVLNKNENMVTSQNNSSQNNSNSSEGIDQIQNFFSKNFGTDLTNSLSFK